MLIRFTCPWCRRDVEAPETAAGATGPCPHCGAQIQAPETTGGAATLVQQPEQPPVAAAEGGYYGPGAPPAPDGTLDLGSILSEAWQLIVTHPGPIVGSHAIAFAINLVLGMGVGFAIGFATMATGGMGSRPPLEVRLFSQGLQWILSLLLLPLSLGPLYVVDQILTQGRSDISVMFRGYRYFGPIVAAAVLITLAVGFGLVFLIVPGLFLAAAFSLAYMEIVDRGVGPIEALRTSWHETEGKRLTLFAYLLVLAIIGLLGILVCCVGYLVTWPLFLTSYAIIYRQIRGLQGRTL